MSGEILLVEDMDLVRITTKNMLVHLGFTVLEAENYEDAIELLRKHKSTISLVVTDLDLPGHMDGLRLRMFVWRNFPDLKCILISGLLRAPEIDRMAEICFDAAIPKPFVLPTLESALVKIGALKR